MFVKNTTGIIVLISAIVISYCSFFIPKKDGDKKYALKYPSYFGPKAQHSRDTLKKNIIQLGRFLFYDKRLSGSNTVSCANCHIQEYAFSDTAKQSTGEGGITKRNSMSLTNLLWQDKFFWDGRVRTLEEQALIPIQNKIEMNQNIDLLVIELSKISLYQKLFTKAYGNNEISSKKIAQAISQFEKTIISSSSKFDKFLSGDTTIFNLKEKSGYKLFIAMPNPSLGIRGAGCASCHKSPFLLSYSFQNNGIDSVFTDLGLGEINHNRLDNGKFKVPSLRNIALTAPYMHDGRFKNLTSVIEHYNNNIKESHSLASFLKGISNDQQGKSLNLTKEEIESLIAFLNTLSDQTLISKKEYSNPF